MTAAAAAALRAAARTLPDQAGTGLLIDSGAFLHRDDFTRFISYRTTPAAALTAHIDWHAMISALHAGQLPLSGGERRILTLAASLAHGTRISLQDAIPGLDTPNLNLLTTAIRHAAGHHR